MLVIKNIKDEPLFERKRIDAISEGTTPKKEEARQEIAKQLNTQEELVVVKNVYQKYGMQQSKINAFVYDNAEAVSKFERKKKEKEEGKKKEEKSAAEKEKKGEVKKEEKPTERTEEKTEKIAKKE